MNVDWSKAPEGATHHVDGGWYKKMVGKWYYWFEVEQGWIDTKYTDPENFSWWGRRVERPAAPQWNGEGLPPVGTVCMVYPHNTLWGFSSTSGHRREILAYHCDFVWLGNDCMALESARIDKVDFKPFCTPEQIAAEERENDLNRMVATAQMLDKGWARKVCEALYDHGYRKQEQPE